MAALQQPLDDLDVGVVMFRRELAVQASALGYQSPVDFETQLN